MATHASVDREREASHVVSEYGFLVPSKGPDGPYVLDLYVPTPVIHQLHLRAGSGVLVQGLSGEDDEEFYIRGRTGLERPASMRQPFTAIIRLPNEPHVLSQFLQAAKKEGIRFQAIRTFGYRGDKESEVVFEGSFPEEEPHFIYRLNLRRLLESLSGRFKGRVTSEEILRFVRPLHGSIMSARYSVTLPVFQESYLKIRIPSNREAYFKTDRGRVLLVRLRLDVASTTLTVDTRFSKYNHYLVVFTGAELKEAPPVTNAILEQLPVDVNVDSISAYEWVRFDPATYRNMKDAREPLGRIEMLCNSFQPLDTAEVTSQLTEALSSSLAPTIRIDELSCRSLNDWLKDVILERQGKPGPTNPQDPALNVFRPILDDGRYAVVRQLGKGTFGEVFQYCDLRTGAMVAGKHFIEQMGSQELDTLIGRASDFRSRTQHLVRLHGHFFHDTTPVIVTEFVPIALHHHWLNPDRDKNTVPHNHPGSLEEAIHMSLDLCEGLSALHEPPDGGEEEAYVHRDIKPANVGGVPEPGRIVWKIFDFGLAKRMPTGMSEAATRSMGGTPEYMSPQAFDRKSPQNDIFALGVTLFEVLCGWKHPSRQPQGGRIGSWAIPIELAEYLVRPKGSGEGPAEYDRSRWEPHESFRTGPNGHLSSAALESLGDIVFGMLRFDAEKRTGSVRQVHGQLAGWARQVGMDLKARGGGFSTIVGR